MNISVETMDKLEKKAIREGRAIQTIGETYSYNTKQKFSYSLVVTTK